MEEIEEELDAIYDLLEKEYSDNREYALLLMIAYYSTLTWNGDDTSKNISLITASMPKYRSLLESKMIDSYSRISLKIDSLILKISKYYGFELDGFSDELIAYKVLLKQAMIDDSRLIINPIVYKAILDMRTGATYLQFQSMVKKYKVPSGVLIGINDSITGVFRRLLYGYGNSVGTTEWDYVGGIKGNTRSFCRARVGNRYTTKEIQAWVSLDWKGKMKSTTKKSIFEDAGGHNCQHLIMAVKPK